MTNKIVAYSSVEFNATQNNKLFIDKLQISSIPGVSPKERNRYRVILGNRFLGDRLTLEEALKLAKRGGN